MQLISSQGGNVLTGWCVHCPQYLHRDHPPIPPILPRPPTAPPDLLLLPPQFDVSAVLKFGPVRLIIPLRVSNISFKVGRFI